jgi:hypothetical protein
MENGLNFEKPLRLLRQAKEQERRMERSRNVRIHSCITISLLQALQKNIGEKETLYLIAHIGLLKLLKKT